MKKLRTRILSGASDGELAEAIRECCDYAGDNDNLPDEIFDSQCQRKGVRACIDRLVAVASELERRDFARRLVLEEYSKG